MKFEDVDCLLCGRDRTREVGKRISPDRDRRLDTRIVQCVLCGLIYPNPMPRLTYEEIQNNFLNHDEYFPTSVDLRCRDFEKVLGQIETLRPVKGKLLDVGCGRGEFLYTAGKRGWAAIGTDISESFVNYARKTFDVRAMAGDLTDVKLPEMSFDAATLVSVIQFLQDPIDTLKRVNRLLKTGGVLYIETTNDDALVLRIADFFKRMKERDKVTTHLSPLFPAYQLYGFNKKSLIKALELTGFETSSLGIYGKRGGGRVKGRGAGNLALNFIRRMIIYMGGSIGMGHLIICLAKKERTI